jgi:hypothetical protein
VCCCDEFSSPDGKQHQHGSGARGNIAQIDEEVASSKCASQNHGVEDNTIEVTLRRIPAS